ncbi:extracellular catalytic domain type 1 short-chain-length polyhydroxyalkanoate depolymerase [Peterkaempfera bronchialis]|uniref:Esterase n=1 Tax=Peterkaempfera bronchialis TaxID=2126346 RepID=A0A345SU12_9ACTN|nr:PHB depolymerase family esterase [Peterkaempfera bronchialis]AXI77217.1 esterase [Peterkaempfera bronchialis]
MFDRSRSRRKGRALLTALLGGVVPLLAALLMAAPSAHAASLTEVTGFGSNPSNLRMYAYVPNNVSAKPPILVAVHYCTGSGPAFFSGSEFASLADRYGFIVIYPSATRDGSCFDVSSPQALKRGGGSDPVGIMSMVTYAEQHYGGDPNRVYVTGASSGAMMTNVLLGDYPDVFKAGSAFMGVPFGCFATTDGSSWNSACANGQVSKTPQQWGDLVRAAYPGYSGARPRMQLWHGTADPTLQYPNFGEEIKQWTNVLGVSQTAVFTDHPQSSWTRTRYGATGTQAPVEAISIQGVGHSLPTNGMAAQAIAFFGLDGSTPPTSPPTNPPTTPPTTPPTSQPPTTPPPTSPSGACKVEYTVSAWNNGLTTAINITNTGSTTVNGWSLAFTLPSGQVITSGWNATYSPTSGAVTAKDAGYNAVLSPGASTSIGFQATHTGNAGKPASFTLNGAACQTV